MPIGTTIVSHLSSPVGVHQQQRTTSATSPGATLHSVYRTPVDIELPDLDGLIACRTSQSLDGTTVATRRQIKGPRQVTEPWETYSPTAGETIEVAPPTSQTLLFSYYIEDTLPPDGPWTVPRIIDKLGKDDDGRDAMVKEVITQPLNPPPVDPDDATKTFPAHWKYALDGGLHWKSVFPGEVRMPARIHQLHLAFSFAEDIVSLADFHKDLYDHNGRIRMQVPGDILQEAVRSITGQKIPEDDVQQPQRLFLLVTSINVVQRRFNLPIQFDMQLYSVPVEGRLEPKFAPPEQINPINALPGSRRSCLSNSSLVQMCVPSPVSWFCANIPNPHYFKTGLAQSNQVADANKSVVNWKYTACPVLPDTNSDSEHLLAGISNFSRHPMFPRWIFVDKAKVEEELVAYTYWDKASVYYRVPCPSNNLEAKARDAEKGKFVQFICLDEWVRMCQYWETCVKSEQNKSEPVIESEKTFQQKLWGTYRTRRQPDETQPMGSMHDQLYFFVPKLVLNYFVAQKFSDDSMDQTYMMNKDRYLMRVDTPVYLELSLPHSNTTAVLAQLQKMAQQNPQRYVSFHCSIKVLFETCPMN